jgi:cytochrome c oxidase assembly protein subunit 15
VVWLHRYACLVVVATLILVAAGGMVTSTNSGLAVPDWPTTYGYQMFAFPLSGMVGGIFYEHGHRLIASAVGMLTIGLVVLLWRVEPRAWVRRLGYLALAAVVIQGTLGGLTVLFFLPDAISISHAGLAQVFFALTVTIALVTSAGWRRPASSPVDDDVLGRRAVTLTAAVYGQIILGATMRHTGAGLAIPDFPLSYGRLLPPFWNTAILIHFSHRLGAIVVATLVLIVVWRIRTRHKSRPELVRPAWCLLAAVVLQITLGAFVVLTGKHEVINTLHVAIGALVFGTSVFLTLRTFRLRLDQPEAVHQRTFGAIKHEA